VTQKEEEEETQWRLQQQIFIYLMTVGNPSSNSSSTATTSTMVSTSSLFLSSPNSFSLSPTVSCFLWMVSTSRLLPSRLFQRFTNLTSLDLTCYNGDLNELLSQVFCFPLKLTWLNLSSQSYIPAIGLQAFSLKITTLTSLICSNIRSFNSKDLFLIAECFPLLEILDLSDPLCCNDSSDSFVHGVETLSLALFRLRKINLSGQACLNNKSLFHLFKNCNLLEETIVSNCDWRISIGIENSKFLKDIVVRPQLKSLDLGKNQWLRDKSIIMFASIFPNLQLLNLRYCYHISKVGICQVLKRCCQIRHLNISCSSVNLLEINFEVPKLEVLNLSHTDVNDETLYVTSKNCRGLLHLLLKNCYGVTNNGVRRVVENCTQLKEIDLRGCDKVSANVVASVASSRKIIALFE